MRMSVSAMLAAAIICLSGQASAQPALDMAQAPADAPSGSVAIPLYGKNNPGKPSDEITSRLMGRETVIRNITYPTLTPVLPRPGTANGAAVIVAPGGGFQMLSMQNEGWRVAQALADHGVAAFVLKYRLNPTPKDEQQWLASFARLLSGATQRSGQPREIKDPQATQDGLAALKLVRARATEWGVNPGRVGMIGFSAGAITTLNSILEAQADADPATNPPDFIGYIYGPMGKIAVPASAPPMFAALAMDDPLFGNGDFSIVSAWHAAKRPVELHAYQTGSHGFGLGRPGTTTGLLMDEFLAWMGMQGLLKPN